MKLVEKSMQKIEKRSASVQERSTMLVEGMLTAMQGGGKPIKAGLTPTVVVSHLLQNSFATSSAKEAIKLSAAPVTLPQMKTLKASGLAKLLRKAPAGAKTQVLSKILAQFMSDLARRARQLNITGSQDIVTLVNSLDTKWRSFAKKVGGIDPEGFLYILEKEKKPVWDVYSAHTRTASVALRIDAKKIKL